MTKPTLIKHTWYVGGWIRNNTARLSEYFGESDLFFLDRFHLLDSGDILLDCYNNDGNLISFTLTPDEFKMLQLDFDLRTQLNKLP